MTHSKQCGIQVVLSAVLVLGLSGSLALASDNIDPDDSGAQYAWSENTGWLNAEPGGDGGPGMFVEDDGVSGYLWSENTGWVSLSCLNNRTCLSRDYRVTNDGAGNLAGYAWSENVGWISFSCSNTNACSTKNYGVTIDPATGDFNGRAWSENTGWISFRNQSGSISYGVETAWRPLVLSWDLDLNGEGNVWDGSMICRYLDPAITDSEQVGAGLVDPSGGRPDPKKITEYLSVAEARGMLDADGNGTSDHFDCKIITAFLFGITSDSLFANGLGSGATRTTADALLAFLRDFLPGMGGAVSTPEAVTVSTPSNVQSLASALTSETTASIVLEQPLISQTIEPVKVTKPSSAKKKSRHKRSKRTQTRRR